MSPRCHSIASSGWSRRRPTAGSSSVCPTARSTPTTLAPSTPPRYGPSPKPGQGRFWRDTLGQRPSGEGRAVVGGAGGAGADFGRPACRSGGHGRVSRAVGGNRTIERAVKIMARTSKVRRGAGTASPLALINSNVITGSKIY